MPVASICQHTVDTVRAVESTLAAAQRTASRCVGTLVVVDVDDHAIGILTDRDLALRVVAPGLDPSTTSVADVMSGELKLCTENEAVDAALVRMREYNVRRLPVVDESGHLCGIVSLEDVLMLLTREMADIGAFVQQTAPSWLATS